MDVRVCGLWSLADAQNNLGWLNRPQDPECLRASGDAAAGPWSAHREARAVEGFPLWSSSVTSFFCLFTLPSAEMTRSWSFCEQREHSLHRASRKEQPRKRRFSICGPRSPQRSRISYPAYQMFAVRFIAVAKLQL